MGWIPVWEVGLGLRPLRAAPRPHGQTLAGLLFDRLRWVTETKGGAFLWNVDLRALKGDIWLEEC
jgi:hypothetical protein